MEALPVAGNAGQRKPAPRDEVPWALIGLRGCLALLVIFDHAMGQLDPKFDMVKIFGFDVATRVFCHRAIILFFSLSAYQLTIKLLKDCPAPDTTPGTRKEMLILWGKYAMRRFFRIYPGFAFALGLLTVYQPLNACYWDISSNSWSEFFQRLRLQNIGGIFWTVPPELQYYLFIPVFVMAYKAAESMDLSISGKGSSSAAASFPLRCSIRVLVLIPGCLSFWRMRLSPFGKDDWCMLDPYFFTFYLGSLAAVFDYTCQRAVADTHSGLTPYAYLLHICERWPVVRWSVRLAAAALTWLLFLVSLDLPSLVSTVHPEEKYVTHYWFPRPQDEGYVVVCTLLVLLGGMCHETMPGSWARLMKSKPLLLAGNLSFSIYLLHPLGLCFIRNYIAPTNPFRFYILYFVTFIMAYPAHEFVEKPGILAGTIVAKRFEGWMRRERPASSEQLPLC